MVLVIARINDRGYHISMTQFVLASTLADVVMALSTQQEDDDIGAVIEKMKKSSEYTSADLEGDHKKVVLDMISRSFAEKGDLTTLASPLGGQTEHCGQGQVRSSDRSLSQLRRPFRGGGAPLCAISFFQEHDRRGAESRERGSKEEDRRWRRRGSHVSC